MWYIIKPILKLLCTIIYIIGVSIIYVIAVVFYFIFTFKILKYGDLNNNEGKFNPDSLLDNDEPFRIHKKHELYYREKNPYDSWKVLCEDFNDLIF